MMSNEQKVICIEFAFAWSEFWKCSRGYQWTSNNTDERQVIKVQKIPIIRQN